MPSTNSTPPNYRPEKVAYWFFRLNGCTTIENFVVHPDTRGSQRTEVDILAVRFPHRYELLTSGKPMVDYSAFTEISSKIQIILAEVKGGNSSCTLNGPWTAPEKKNMQRVLYAFGAFPPNRAPEVAARLYQDRLFDDGAITVRLFAIGTRKSQERIVAPPVVQLTWDEILRFIYERLHDYVGVKGHHPQWNRTGTNLYKAVRRLDLESFVRDGKEKMGVSGG